MENKKFDELLSHLNEMAADTFDEGEFGPIVFKAIVFQEGCWQVKFLTPDQEIHRLSFTSAS